MLPSCRSAVGKRTLTVPENLPEEKMSDPGSSLNEARCVLKKLDTACCRIADEDGNEGGGC